MKLFFKKSLTFIMIFFLLILTFVVTTKVRAAVNDLIAEGKVSDCTTSGYAIHKSWKTTDDINWYMSFGQPGYLGVNNSNNFNKAVLSNANDLAVVKGAYPDVTSTDKGYIAFYSDNLFEKVGKIIFNSTATSGGKAEAYLVCKKSGQDNWSKVTLNDATTTAQGAQVESSAATTFTFTFNTIDSAQYGIVFYRSANTRLTAAKLSLYEGEINTNPTININNSISNIMINDEYIFSASSENITSSSPIVWASSNEDAAMIDESTGEIVPVGIGSTEITASIDDVISPIVKLNVYPNNSTAISISTAIETCDFLATKAAETEDDTVKTPYDYTCVGTVSQITDTNNFIITDGTNSISVYKYGNNVAINAKISISGKLCYYKTNSINQFFSPEIVDLYTVTFNSNEGTTVSPITDVVSGSTITKPTDPTRTDYEFLGWYNGSTEWNFTTDTVTDNVTLTAKWASNVLSDFLNDFNLINAHMSMAYKYNITQSSTNISDTLIVTDLNLGSSYSNFSSISKTSTAVYAGNAYKNGNNIQFKSKDSISGLVTTTSGGKAVKVSVAWITTGKTIDVYGKNTAYTDATDLYNSATQGTKLGSIIQGTATEFSITGDYEYIGIRSNDGSIQISEIKVEWGGATTYTNVDFRIRCGIDNSAASLVSSLPGATYGIEVSDGTNTKYYVSTNSLVTIEPDENGMIYVIIDLGDVLNNTSRIDTVFTVRAYVEYEEEKYFSASDCSYSIETMIKAYHDMSADEYKDIEGKTPSDYVNGLYNILSGLGYDFE